MTNIKANTSDMTTQAGDQINMLCLERGRYASSFSSHFSSGLSSLLLFEINAYLLALLIDFPVLIMEFIFCRDRSKSA